MPGRGVFFRTTNMPRQKPLDKNIARLIADLSGIDFVQTTSSCEGHGEGEKEFYINFKIPKSKHLQYMFYGFMMDVISNRKLCLKRSIAGNLGVYLYYKQINELKDVIEHIKSIIEKYKKNQEGEK